MRRIMTTILLILTLITTMVTPALANNYEFNGADPGVFGKPTSVDEAQTVGGYQTEADNINRSKDSTIWGSQKKMAADG